MCGIFGYVGKQLPLAFLVEGLQKLEYRGYDSCGIACLRKEKLFLQKRPGKIEQLKKQLDSRLHTKTELAVLHTRWATHGKPNKANAHPHLGCQRKIAAVHNGIIENFLQLKEQLGKEGHKFSSETDTEVIVHLIEKYYKGSLAEAVKKTVTKLEGSFALGVFCIDEPDTLLVARKASPLIIGLSKEGNFIASDIPALLSFTKEVIYLKDNELAVLKKESLQLFNFKGKPIKPLAEKVKIETQDAGKKGYEHFMLKEIYEQPQVIKKILSMYYGKNKIHFPDFDLGPEYLGRMRKIFITACGTAYHAGYVAKYFFEKHCGLDVEIDTSSEFRYRRLNLKKDDLLIAISQSGETADTLAAVREAKKCGAKVLGVCNVLGSSLTKESHGLIATLAGPEIGVASTKAYTAQVFCLYLFGMYLANIRKTTGNNINQNLLQGLRKIPIQMQDILKHSSKVKRIANSFSKFGSFLFLGRGINYPSALEGALKLKEISYIPAEGYAAGEMKHGPIALIDEYRGVVCIAPKDKLHEKMLSNMQEARARKGKVLAIVNGEDVQASTLSDKIIHIPKSSHQDLSPLLVAPALQLFAYFVAKNLGCEIDQPRNLAKSVTVE